MSSPEDSPRSQDDFGDNNVKATVESEDQSLKDDDEGDGDLFGSDDEAGDEAPA